ncbi:MAG: hypothetical protein CVT63_00565 [Candidatus Anoxymicrobium japonicum]|uniref:Uncharacterized protein n=1 Tax=Candidatus Anoxymicrobium japonicum TaxID=2013648 RepID=A0A2N3G853_9ACTN|nr:MAG: hypothetical protein CVT63_00565 [Candidatus Anoxymicrobium japonicum]
MQPDFTNVETPDKIAGVSALALFIALFLPWVHVSVNRGLLGMKVSVNAGPSFAWISILSVLAVFAVLALTVFDMELPLPAGLVYLGAGALAVLLAIIVILLRPIGGAGFSIAGVSKIPWYGAFIGLIAAVGIAVGGFLKLQGQRY